MDKRDRETYEMFRLAQESARPFVRMMCAVYDYALPSYVMREGKIAEVIYPPEVQERLDRIQAEMGEYIASQIEHRRKCALLTNDGPSAGWAKASDENSVSIWGAVDHGK